MSEGNSYSRQAVLTANTLCKEFAVKGKPAVHALKQVSLVAHKGEVTGLVGADGAGKTTLIRIAAGLLTPSSGDVKLLGLDSVKDSIEIQSRVGYMPQKFGLYQDLSVIENMSLYADLQGVAMGERKARYERLLEMTDLARYVKRKAGALSGGMKQKLGLACALIKSPELLLLDEPTVGVDPVSRRELWKIVYELVEQDGIGVFVSTAYLDEAERCDHVLVLHQGKLIAEGEPETFTATMKGRVCLVNPSRKATGRALYTRLAGSDGVVDTTIRSGRVRVVLVEADPSLLHSTLDGFDAEIEVVQPGFEDAFMAMIPRGQDHVTVASDRSPAKGLREDVIRDDDSLVKTNNLCKMFGDFEAVKNLSFTVKRGEIFGLLGPNGAGKSTTFRMLCGLLPASSGEIEVAGHDLLKSRARARARLGYMAQQFSLYGQLSVEENLVFFGKVYGLNRKKLKERIAWAYEEFNLGDWQGAAAFGLPGGYKQRLAMAAALLHEPDILFLDEPTSGVDPFARREFWLRINGFAELGVTVVVTTHFMEEAEYCDRMLIMSQGATLAMGTPAEIRNLVKSAQNPRPTMADAFIGLAEGNVSAGLSIEGGV